MRKFWTPHLPSKNMKVVYRLTDYVPLTYTTADGDVFKLAIHKTPNGHTALSHWGTGYRIASISERQLLIACRVGGRGGSARAAGLAIMRDLIDQHGVQAIKDKIKPLAVLNGNGWTPSPSQIMDVISEFKTP